MVPKLFSKCSISKDQTKEQLEENSTKSWKEATLPPTVGLSLPSPVGFCQDHSGSMTPMARLLRHDVLASLGNMVNLEESVIMSYDMEIQVRRFGRIRKDLEDKSMHNNHQDDRDDDSIYIDGVSYEELQDKYSLFYTKWVGLLE
ncbi:hypothetical protein M9H77_27818 [Catharanthus roseus]|uniref:Uncharacterized protein n=1 Tax=Catharanthus roseus TaxID=4058 RepID=A0ACC0AF84_CATRO|nr:hypothetical protein M9H77_27818 [Catharanthus roseus]